MSRRLLVVSPYDVDSFGGVQMQVAGIARALAATGEDVVLVAPGRGGDRERDGYRICPAAGSISVPINGSRAPVAPTPAAWAAVRAVLRRFGPDVVHLHEPLAPGPSLFAMYLFEGPIVGTFHRARPGRLYPAFARLNVRAVRGVDVHVAVSAAAEATARIALGPTYRGDGIVPNGIDASSPAPAKAVSDRPTVLFVGRHEHRKGLDVLLRAVTGSPAEMVLWVIGEGPETETLKERFTDPRITWLGAVDDAEKRRRLLSADLLVAPSLGGESFGVILLEAMAAATAIVASDLPGYREAGGDAAMYVPPGDVAALRSTITSVLSDRQDRRRLGDAGLQRAARHDFSVIAARYREWYDVALERSVTKRTGVDALRRLQP